MQSVICHFHANSSMLAANAVTTTNGTPSQAKLQYELIALSKCGEFDKALKYLSTLRDLKYPIQSNTYCALLSHATNHCKEDVFNTVLNYINEYNVSYDVQLYTVKIVGNLKFYGFEKAMIVYDEMISRGFSPRTELVNLLFEDCLQRNDTKNSILFCNLCFLQSTLPPVHLIVKFITMCLNNGLHDCLMKLLQFYAVQNIPLDEELVHHLKWYFDSSRDERYRTLINPLITLLLYRGKHYWSTSFTTIDKRYVMESLLIKLTRT